MQYFATGLSNKRDNWSIHLVVIFFDYCFGWETSRFSQCFRAGKSFLEGKFYQSKTIGHFLKKKKYEESFVSCKTIDVSPAI